MTTEAEKNKAIADKNLARQATEAGSQFPPHQMAEFDAERAAHPEYNDTNHRNARISHPELAPGQLPDGLAAQTGIQKRANVPAKNPGDKDGGEPLGTRIEGER